MQENVWEDSKKQKKELTRLMGWCCPSDDRIRSQEIENYGFSRMYDYLCVPDLKSVGVYVLGLYDLGWSR